MKENRTPEEEVLFQTHRNEKIKKFAEDLEWDDKFKGLNLQIGLDGQAEARALITWCIPPDTAKQMASYQNNRSSLPYILLSVVYEGKREVERLVMPFHKMATYVTFRRPGSYSILGVIFWSSEPIWKLREFWYKRPRDNYYYSYDLFDAQTSLEYEIPLEQCFVSRWLGGYIGFMWTNVHVDPKFFAKEWPRWVRDFVDGWYDQQSRDECHFRKRLIFAVLFKSWLLILVWLFMTTTKLILALYYLVNAIRPTKIAWKKIFALELSHDFIRQFRGNREETDYWIKRPYLRPSSLIFFAVLGYYLFRSYSVNVQVQPDLPVRLLVGVISVSALAFMAALVLQVVLQKKDAGSGVMTARQKRRAERKRLREEEKYKRIAEWRAQEKLAVEREFEAMTCRVGAKPVLEDLPPEKVTIFLRAAALKNRVCKPFAR